MPRIDHDSDARLLKARERFKLGNEADGPQCDREQDDTSFEDGNQWPTDILQSRLGQQPTNGQSAVPARPTLVINKVRRSVQQVLNQEREADIGVEIVAADDFGDLGIIPDDTEIQLREGLVRRIQRESKAADARSWAFKRAVIAGRGYYLVMTRYLPGKTWDQEIYVHRIYNQAGVVLDPSHEQPDGSDADWGFIGTWVPWERIAAEYPTLADGETTAPYSVYTENDFIAQAEKYPDWYRQSYEAKDKGGATTTIKQVAVRVTDYWYVERVARNVAVLEDGTSVWEDELPNGVTPRDVRPDVQKQIKFCKIVGGCAIVEETEWAGPDMPIVKVLGEEILPYDEQRRAEGMVRQARSSQQGLNYMISKQVEMVGLTPIPPLMVDPEAIEGHETEYAQMNTRTFGSLKYRTYDDRGRELRPPMRPPVSADNIGVSQSIGLFDQAVKDTTAVSDPALGESDPSVKSARHAKYLIDESHLATSNFLDNLARSIRYEGQIENNLLYPIYGARPGRLVRVLTGDGDSQSMRIQDPALQQAQVQQRQRAAKVAKLTKDAHFNVIVKVSKTSTSRREQFVNTFGNILSADPNQMSVGGDLFYKNMDIPEARELAKRQRVMLAPAVQQLIAAEESGQPFDPQAQAKIAQLTEQVQHAEAALKELDQIANGKQLEAQSRLQAEQMKQQAETERAQVTASHEERMQELKNAALIRVAEINLLGKGVLADRSSEDEALALGLEHAHAADQAQLDRGHQAAMGGAQSGTAVDAQQADQSHQAAMADQEHQQAMEQQQQAADLAPKPAAGVAQ